MIITQLNGGLGNQMFQYALGRALSLKHNADLLLDVTSFNYQPHTNTKRKYDLGTFNISIDLASKQVLDKFGRPNRYKVLANRYFHLGFNPYPPNYIKENGHRFRPDILNLPDDVYLSGYWQSEKYFIDIQDIIRDDFSKRNNSISQKNKQLHNILSKGNSVSLHVRRSDYIANKKANSYHGTCNLKYYQQAMSSIEATIKSPIYYVFSDDPEWVKLNIKSKHKIIYITHNQGVDSHEDIRLMAQCKHNIIANSSFSWWSAWLNHNDGKIVIAPKYWVADKKDIRQDLIPNSWTRI
jgi:hypothetical protein